MPSMSPPVWGMTRHNYRDLQLVGTSSQHQYLAFLILTLLQPLDAKGLPPPNPIYLQFILSQKTDSKNAPLSSISAGISFFKKI